MYLLGISSKTYSKAYFMKKLKIEANFLFSRLINGSSVS